VLIFRREVYVAWAAKEVKIDSNSKSPDYFPPEKALVFTRSLDGGNTYGIDNSAYGKMIQPINGIADYNCYSYTWPLIQYLTLNSFPSMCVDRSEGPNRGTIYVVWAEHEMDTTSNQFLDRIDIKMIHSHYKGDTWDPAVTVNQGDWGIGNINPSHSFFPWISCDEESGVLSVIFYDDRGENVMGSGFVNTYVALSKDYGKTWEDCIVSDYLFQPNSGNNSTSYEYGDHIGIGSKNGLTYPVWTDMRLKEEDDLGNYACKPEPYISPFYTWNCVDQYGLVTENVPSWSIREWEVSDSITAIDSVGENGFAIFNAGYEIRFLPEDPNNSGTPGFRAQRGSFVHAYIEGCSPFQAKSTSFTENIPDQRKLYEKKAQEHFSGSSIKLFPNPCDGEFSIELSDAFKQECTLQITDLSGTIVFTQNYRNKSLLNIDISIYPKGIYVIKLTNSRETYTTKLIHV
jgi:hypothetical protein